MVFGGALRSDLIWRNATGIVARASDLTSIDEKRVVPCSGARWPLT